MRANVDVEFFFKLKHKSPTKPWLHDGSYISFESSKLLFSFLQKFYFLSFDQNLLFEEFINFVILFSLMEPSEKFGCK